MKTPHSSQWMKALLFTLLVAAPAAFAQQISWTVNVVPVGSCVIDWSTTLPVQSGTLYHSGKIVFTKNATINFQFTANPGFNLIHVYKNTEDEISWVRANGGKDSFGPVQKAHTITAVCEVLNPTGTFTGNYTDGKGATEVADVTGNYKGSVPKSTTGRTYDADIAMDESGKLMAMGTVTGIANKDGGSQLSSSAGSVKTVNNEPYAALKGSIKGSKDGQPMTASGSAAGDLVLTPSGSNYEASGIATGTSTVAGKKTTAKAAEQTVEVPADHEAAMKKAWGVTLTFTEKTDTKGKKYVESTALLRLSNGEYSKYSTRKVKYSYTAGYSVSFASGQKLDTLGQPVYVKDPKTGANKLDRYGNPIPLIDRKSTLKITKMVLSVASGTWTPVSGTMDYKFLGQKGKGDLTAFLD